MNALQGLDGVHAQPFAQVGTMCFEAVEGGRNPGDRGLGAQ
jgi:hypothetical protein